MSEAIAQNIQEIRYFAQRIEPCVLWCPRYRSSSFLRFRARLFTLRRLLFTLIVAFLPIAAFASPFCVAVIGLPNQCIYDDASSCRARAAQLRGICTINTAEITAGYGHEKFCIVDSFFNTPEMTLK